MKKGSSDSSKLERKIIEKNRRIHMKSLCFKLTSMIPPQYFKPSKDMLSQTDQLDQSAAYIEQLRENIEKLKRSKEQLLKQRGNMTNTLRFGFRQPVVELRDLGSSIEVILVSGVDKNFMLYEVINVLEEEGTQVVNANYWTVNDKIFHSIHAQVKICRVGVDTSRVCARLRDLFY